MPSVCRGLIFVLAAVTVPLALAAAQNPRPGDDMTRFVWKRYPGNPVFPAVAGTWCDVQTANPDLLLNGGTYYMYFRGQRDGHDRLGVATIPKERFDGVTWNIYPEPIIDVGEPGSWDERHALDPAAILIKGKSLSLLYRLQPAGRPRNLPRRFGRRNSLQEI